MKDLVLYIAKNLASNPDKIDVLTADADGELSLKLCVDPSDMGKIIGRSGRTARDIRTVLRAAAGFAGQQVNLEITENV